MDDTILHQDAVEEVINNIVTKRLANFQGGGGASFELRDFSESVVTAKDKATATHTTTGMVLAGNGAVIAGGLVYVSFIAVVPVPEIVGPEPGITVEFQLPEDLLPLGNSLSSALVADTVNNVFVPTICTIIDTGKIQVDCSDTSILESENILVTISDVYLLSTVASDG